MRRPSARAKIQLRPELPRAITALLLQFHYITLFLPQTRRQTGITQRPIPFRVLSVGSLYNMGDFGFEGVKKVRKKKIKYSEEYEEAKKEFVNCILMSVICLGVPIYNAIHEWWPIMKREKQKALQEGNAVE